MLDLYCSVARMLASVPADRLESVMEAALDGSSRDLKGSGDLEQAHVLDKSQQQHLSLDVGKPAQQNFQRVRSPGLIRRGPLRHLAERLPAGSPQVGQGDVADGRIEESAQFGGQPEPLPTTLQQPGERFLRDIHRQMLVSAGDAKCRPPNEVAVAVIKRFETTGLATADGDDEFLIGPLVAHVAQSGRGDSTTRPLIDNRQA